MPQRETNLIRVLQPDTGGRKRIALQHKNKKSTERRKCLLAAILTRTVEDQSLNYAQGD